MNYWEIFFANRSDYEVLAAQLTMEREFTEVVRPVARLYLAYFDRWPDEAGEAYWDGVRRRGVRLENIATYFSDSEEFKLTYGSLDDKAFLRLVYNNVLGRDPDQAGYDHWLTKVSKERLSRGDLMVQFSESQEYRNATDAIITIREIVYGQVQLEPNASTHTTWSPVYRQTGILAPLVDDFLGSYYYWQKFVTPRPTDLYFMAARTSDSGDALPNASTRVGEWVLPRTRPTRAPATGRPVHRRPAAIGSSSRRLRLSQGCRLKRAR